METHSFWKNIMYNENVMKWASCYFIDDDYDVLIDNDVLVDEDIIIYDDSDEWYNDGE